MQLGNNRVVRIGQTRYASTMQGVLEKMSTTYLGPDDPITYEFVLDEKKYPLNNLIGKKISLAFTGEIHCIYCQRKIAKTFAQGACYPCFIKRAETDSCIVKPHLCHHHLGTCRDNHFAEKHCFIPHIVYLAFTSGPKVGITRAHQKFSRWADQGAISATVLVEVANRKIAGDIEWTLSQHIQDKTNWRRMLSEIKLDADLLEIKKNILDKIPANQPYQIAKNELHSLKFPVHNYPQKISSLSFEKTPQISDTLWGIKGQYLIFSSGVINMRKYQGYVLKFTPH